MSFDAIAPWYRTLETIAFGSTLQRARVACLDELRSRRRALIVGEGNGRFLVELHRRYPDVEIDCVDASERMLSLARQRLTDLNPNRVRFLRRDLLAWTPDDGRYDLVVTHFFLDCFPQVQLAEIIGKLSRAATADASWLLADFAIPASGLGRFQARIWLPAMYAFFRSAAGIKARELIDPSLYLGAENFQLQCEHKFRRGMLRSQLWRRR